MWQKTKISDPNPYLLWREDFGRCVEKRECTRHCRTTAWRTHRASRWKGGNSGKHLTSVVIAMCCCCCSCWQHRSNCAKGQTFRLTLGSVLEPQHEQYQGSTKPPRRLISSPSPSLLKHLSHFSGISVISLLFIRLYHLLPLLPLVWHRDKSIWLQLRMDGCFVKGMLTQWQLLIRWFIAAKRVYTGESVSAALSISFCWWKTSSHTLSITALWMAHTCTCAGYSESKSIRNKVAAAFGCSQTQQHPPPQKIIIYCCYGQQQWLISVSLHHSFAGYEKKQKFNISIKVLQARLL